VETHRSLNVGWVGTKWKPTDPQNKNGGFRYRSTHPTLTLTTLTALALGILHPTNDFKCLSDFFRFC
jgi:hypothetical protein